MVDKNEVKRKILEFFNEIENKGAEEIKEIKKLAMSFNVRLRELRKNFCKNCYSPLIPGVTSEVRIKNGIKASKCRICSYINRWKLKQG